MSASVTGSSSTLTSMLSEMMVPGESYNLDTPNLMTRMEKKSANELLSRGTQDFHGTTLDMGTAHQLGVPEDKVLVAEVSEINAYPIIKRINTIIDI